MDVRIHTSSMNYRPKEDRYLVETYSLASNQTISYTQGYSHNTEDDLLRLTFTN